MSLNTLVVDDSAVVRAMVIKTLNMADLDIGEVHQASNGAEGLEVLKDHWVDIAFVDINMPVLDGEEMIARIRSNPNTRDLPVIIVSTEGSRTRVEKFEEDGLKFIHKPFRPEQIRNVVSEVTGVRMEESHETAF